MLTGNPVLQFQVGSDNKIRLQVALYIEHYSMQVPHASLYFPTQYYIATDITTLYSPCGGMPVGHPGYNVILEVMLCSLIQKKNR